MKYTKAHQEVLVAGYSDISNKYGKFKMNRNLICVIIPFKVWLFYKETTMNI